jgi:hypothetical protein
MESCSFMLMRPYAEGTCDRTHAEWKPPSPPPHPWRDGCDPTTTPLAIMKQTVRQADEASGLHTQNLKEVKILDEWGDACVGTIRIDEKRKQFYAYCCQLGQLGKYDHRTGTMTECRLNRKPTAKSKYLGQQVPSLLHNLKSGCVSSATELKVVVVVASRS